MQEMEHSLPIGTKLDGRYIIQSILGEGGFGITYKAHDEKLDCDVAIKEYLPGECAARTGDSITVQPRTNRGEDYQYGLDKFLEEARTLAKFQHSNIVRVSNFIEQNGTAYLVMEFADGVPLDEWLKKKADAVDEAILLKIITPLLQGLSEVHKANLMHRDIKPGNIFLRKKGGPLLIDFGAARQALGEHSRSISAIVSMGYAPPEQYTTRGKQGPYTDLYAVGAVMYKLITGETPIESPDRSHEIHEGEPDPLMPAVEAGKGKVSDWLLQITDQLLNISPKLRPQSASDVLSAIENKTSIAAGAESPVQPSAKQGDNKTRVVKSTERFSKQKPESNKPVQQANEKSKSGFSFAKVAIIFVVIAALGGGGYFFQGGQKASQYRSLAEEQAKLGKLNDTHRLIDQAVSISGADAADKFIIELAERKAKEITVAIAKIKAEEEAKRFAKIRAKQEAEAQALREEQAKKEAEARAKREQEAKERREAQARRDADERVRRAAQLKAENEARDKRMAEQERIAQLQSEREEAARRESAARANRVSSYGDHSKTSIKAPSIAENGAVVPITLTGLGLLRNESATIEDSQGCKLFKVINRTNEKLDFIATRIKLARTSEVHVSFNGDGNVVASKNIKVTIGARHTCKEFSNINNENFDDVSGSKSIKVRARSNSGETTVKALIRHAMRSNNYITDLAIGSDDAGYVHFKMADAVSANPYFSTKHKNISKGENMKIYYVDSNSSGSIVNTKVR